VVGSCGLCGGQHKVMQQCPVPVWIVVPQSGNLPYWNSLPERDYVVTDDETDPRQAYVSYIFHPGQFSVTVIAKALGVSHYIFYVNSYITSRSV